MRREPIFGRQRPQRRLESNVTLDQVKSVVITSEGIRMSDLKKNYIRNFGVTNLDELSNFIRSNIPQHFVETTNSKNESIVSLKNFLKFGQGWKNFAVSNWRVFLDFNEGKFLQSAALFFRTVWIFAINDKISCPSKYDDSSHFTARWAKESIREKFQIWLLSAQTAPLFTRRNFTPASIFDQFQIFDSKSRHRNNAGKRHF